MSEPRSFLDGRVVLHAGDCIAAMREMSENSVDSIVCDPPYFLESISKRFGAENSAPAKFGKDGVFKRASGGFMGKQWDAADAVQLDVELGNWLAGFADGEGCFTTRKINPEGGGYCCEFIIHVRQDDDKIVKHVCAATGIGKVYFQERRYGPMVKWVVSKKDDCMKLVQIFRAFPLRAKKKHDFEIWAKAVDEWVKHEPNTSWDSVRFHAEMLSHVKRFGASPNPVQFFHYRWAKEAIRILKPGGYLFAFSGCRVYHRMACAIEDAGFITHPMFCWATGQGFPKAHNLSKQLDEMAGAERGIIRKGASGTTAIWNKNGGMSDFDITAPATDAAREWDGWFYGTQSLKPAIEPVYFGQKPFERGLNGAQNVLKWGTGAINVGGCKVQAAENIHRTRNYVKGGYEPEGTQKEGQRVFTEYNSTSRWPANLIHDGSEEVLACFPETASGEPGIRRKPHSGADRIGQLKNAPLNGAPETGIGDSGSAARFFATFPQDEEPYATRLLYHGKADADDRCGSRHPTVKPIALIQELARLITPRGGTCLDLFAGTGITGEACFREGFRAILIEREAEYITDIERRMSLVMEGPATRAHASMKARGRPRDDGPLLGGSEEPPRHPRPTGCIRNGAEGPFGKDRFDEAAE